MVGNVLWVGILNVMRFRGKGIRLMGGFGVFGRMMLKCKIFRIECFVFPFPGLGDFPEGFGHMWMRVREVSRVGFVSEISKHQWSVHGHSITFNSKYRFKNKLFCPFQNDITLMSLNKKKITMRLVKENKIKQYPFLNLFILITIVLQVVAEILNIYFLALLKPIPIIMMVIYISGKNAIRDHLLPTLIKNGLLFSVIADLLTMSKQLSSFAIATILYSLTYVLYSVGMNLGQVVRSCSMVLRLTRMMMSLLLVLISIGVCYYLWDIIPNKIILISEGILMVFLSLSSLFRYERTTPYSFRFMSLGSLLLWMGNFLLLYIEYYRNSWHFGRGIMMLSSYAGHYLLMHGSLHHSNLQNQISKFFKYKAYRQ